jgi:hypothetical protein
VKSAMANSRTAELGNRTPRAWPKAEPMVSEGKFIFYQNSAMAKRISGHNRHNAYKSAMAMTL